MVSALVCTARVDPDATVWVGEHGSAGFLS